MTLISELTGKNKKSDDFLCSCKEVVKFAACLNTDSPFRKLFEADGMVVEFVPCGVAWCESANKQMNREDCLQVKLLTAALSHDHVILREMRWLLRKPNKLLANYTV